MSVSQSINRVSEAVTSERLTAREGTGAHGA